MSTLSSITTVQGLGAGLCGGAKRHMGDLVNVRQVFFERKKIQLGALLPRDAKLGLPDDSALETAG